MDSYTLEKIKEILQTSTLKPTGNRASGCINEGETYQTDQGLVFIKRNNGKKAKIMFESEFASLVALEQTKTIKVPHPIGVVEGSKDMFYCIMEHVDIKNLKNFSTSLGEKLAMLHLHNKNVAKNDSSLNYISKFGFHQTTCVGLLPVSNEWTEDWPTFYNLRLQEQIERLENKAGKALNLWNKLSPLLPKFFENIDIYPSLLHGDLWTGNVGETKEEPIIFDPGSVYGHHEFDLAMTTMFGSLPKNFYDSYHGFIPREKGFRSREKLYHLFHALNHWNHFGGGYKEQSLRLMESLIKTSFPIID